MECIMKYILNKRGKAQYVIGFFIELLTSILQGIKKSNPIFNLTYQSGPGKT